MEKRLAVVWLVLIAILTACGGTPAKEQKMAEVTKLKSGEITKIVFSDGRGWNHPIELKDPQKIAEFMSMLDGYVVKKEKKHEPSTGWIHRADFYKGDQKVMEITFTNPMKIDGGYYDTLKGNIGTEKLDEFIQSFNPEWKK